MSRHLTTGEAARLLNVTVPTVRLMLERGRIRGTRVPRATRSYWQVDEESVQEYLAARATRPGRARPGSRLDRIEAELGTLHATVDALVSGSSPAPPENLAAVERERDGLRVRVVNLEENLARMAAASDLQREADAARTTVVENLLAALTAAERADALRREVIENLDEALGVFRRPGHVGEMS